MMKTGLLYGKYSHPFGIIYSQTNINIRKKTLKKLPFFKKIGNFKVLELGGTGQDAVAWGQLGFETTYIDLSKENINKTRKFIKGKNLKIKCINSDFLKYNFKQKFDLIRSRGVIHHINQPEKTLIKIYKLLNEGGYFHFNLYRSGTFYYWFVENLRLFTKKINFKLFLKNLLTIRPTKIEKNYIGNQTIKSVSKFYNIIIDDLYVPVLMPANYFEIKNLLKNIGFKIIKENKLKKRIDHDINYPDFPKKKKHIVFDCKKILIKKSKLVYLKKLRKQTEVSLTQNDPIINANNKLFKLLFKIMCQKKLFLNYVFIKQIIKLYKNLYLFCVKNMSKVSRHKKLKNMLLDLIKKY